MTGPDPLVGQTVPYYPALSKSLAAAEWEWSTRQKTRLSLFASQNLEVLETNLVDTIEVDATDGRSCV